ncbi:MAG: DMT family transporter [Bauldia sp.]
MAETTALTGDAPAGSARRYRAILLVVVAVTLFGVMDGLGRFLSPEFSVLQLLWARFAFAIPVVLATTTPAAWLSLLRSERPALQAARSLLPLIASCTVLIGLTLMPLADITAITFAAPLFVVALSWPILGERVRLAVWVSVGLGFVGVLVVARPGLGTFTWAALFPLASALLFGLYQVLTRLVSRGDPPATTLAWTIVVGFVLTTPLLPLDWQAGSLGGWLLVVLTGLLFGVAHFLLIRAFATAPAAILTPFTYSQMVAAVLFGMLVLSEVPDPWTLAGTALIVLAGLYVLRGTRRTPALQSEAPASLVETD